MRVDGTRFDKYAVGSDMNNHTGEEHLLKALIVQLNCQGIVPILTDEDLTTAMKFRLHVEPTGQRNEIKLSVEPDEKGRDVQ